MQMNVYGLPAVLAANRSVNGSVIPALAPSIPELSRSGAEVTTPSPAGGANLRSISSSICEAPPGQSSSSVVASWFTGSSGRGPASRSGSHNGKKVFPAIVNALLDGNVTL